MILYFEQVHNLPCAHCCSITLSPLPQAIEGQETKQRLVDILVRHTNKPEGMVSVLQ